MRLQVSFEADVSPLDRQIITAIVNTHYDHLVIAAHLSRRSAGKSTARKDADEAFAGLGLRVTFAA